MVMIMVNAACAALISSHVISWSYSYFQCSWDCHGIKPSQWHPWLKSPQGYPLCDKPLYSDIHPASQFFSEPDKALGRVGGELDILARDRVDETELIPFDRSVAAVYRCLTCSILSRLIVNTIADKLYNILEVKYSWLFEQADLSSTAGTRRKTPCTLATPPELRVAFQKLSFSMPVRRATVTAVMIRIAAMIL